MSIYVKNASGDRRKVAGAGLPGPAGKSAYQYAVEGGFSGTEDEFRALMGVRSNSNLLHNAYWASKDYITNQLGQEEYTEDGYTIDRWISIGLTVTLEDGWLKLQNTSADEYGYFLQLGEIGEYDSLVGSQYAISALYKCNTQGCDVHSGCTTTETDDYHVVHPSVLLDADGQPHAASSAANIQDQDAAINRWEHMIISAAPGATVWLKAAKLERGPVQTLAHQDEEGNWVLNDPPPDKALEQLKCQRYYRVFATQNLRPTKAEDYCPPMRVNPALGTIVINGVTYYTADANL